MADVATLTQGYQDLIIIVTIQTESKGDFPSLER